RLAASPRPRAPLPRSFPTRRSSDLLSASSRSVLRQIQPVLFINGIAVMTTPNEWSKGVVEGALAEPIERVLGDILQSPVTQNPRSEEHTSELQSRFDLVCRLLLEKK